VSSANRTGQPAATTVDEAEQQLGETVSVYLDGGPCTDNIPSTILDLTGTIPTLLRAGAISVDRLRTVASVIADNERRTGSTEGTEFKPAAPHPLDSGGARVDAPTDEWPSGGEPVA
jgi:L-threonylcarbamoyladenylate synthase